MSQVNLGGGALLTTSTMLSIIFVNWNSTSYLLECIASIYQWANDIALDIIVVDNASPAADVDLVKQRFPNITLLKSPDNLGFARANNLGFQHSRGNVLLFLNPDTKLIGPAINILLRQLSSLPDAGVVGCKLLNGDLSVQTSCIQRFPTILNQALDLDILRNRWPRSRLWGTAPLFCADPRPAKVEVISGACMMMKRKTFERVGMFTVDYFMYAEDLDLSYKVVRAGYRNYFVGEATVIHYGGKSSTPATAPANKWRSILRYIAKNRGGLYVFLFRCVMVMVATCRLAIVPLLSVMRQTSLSKMNGCSVSSKWRSIIKTLLTPLPALRAGKEV